MEESISNRLKTLRENNNLTQAEMAKILEITLQSYQRFEYNSRRPSLDVLITLADYFNISIDYLVGRSEDPTRH